MNLRNYFTVASAALAGGLSLLPAVSNAEPITTLFNTGLSAEGQTDPNWTLGTNAGSYGPSLLTASNGTFPLISNWLQNNATSKWLVPNNTQASHVPGDYNFLTSFSLSGFVPSSASITFRFAVDNTVTGVFLNGTSLAVTGTGFAAFSPSFTRDNTTNPGIFLPGTNTLRFVVNNAPGTTQNPTGLRVEIAGSATVVPESNTSLLAGLVLPFIIGIVARRRK